MNQKLLNPLRLLIFISAIGFCLFLSSRNYVGAISQKKIKSESPNTEKLRPQQANLEKYITVEAALLGVSDNISLYFKDLDHYKEVNIDSTRSWIPASTIKAFVILEAFRQRRIGLIDFDRRVVIRGDNVVPTELESDEFPLLVEGTSVTIKQLIESMIIQSDNTAYNTLLDILDRRNINYTLRNLGITETVVGEKLNLDDGQFQNDLAVPGRQPNTTTAKDVATLFDLLYNKEVPDSDEILAIFKKQKINNMIPAFLPKSTVVAHKTGDWRPLFHDGGVVFKPKDPFVLAIFTNSNDPSVLAKIAQVAYYQNEKVVGQNAPLENLGNEKTLRQYHSRIYLAAIKNESKVLGVGTSKAESKMYIVQKGDTLWGISEKFYNTGLRWVDIARRNYLKNPSTIDVGIKLIIPPLKLNVPEEHIEKFPKITASDLGIAIQDVTVGKEEAQRVQNALITPRAFILYSIKLLIEKIQLATVPNNRKASLYLTFAKNRLAEAKTLLEKGDSSDIEQLLNKSEDNLKNATVIAKTNKTPDTQLLEIKQVSDLHFATLAQSANLINSKNKEKFIDAVYNFYQRGQREVAPVVKTSSVANPLVQEPLIGTIDDIKDNIVSLRFDNGTIKKVIIESTTPVRDFHKHYLDKKNSLVVGSRIAVVSNHTKEGQTFPLFILRNIPKELSNKHEGVVLEINPPKNTLQIQSKTGQKENVKVGEETVVKAKDTGVSLEGIKAGSQVTIFGEVKKVQQNQPEVLKKESAESEIKATSITVTKNSSGAQEKIESGEKKETKPQTQPKDEKKPAKDTEKKETKKEEVKPTESKLSK